MSCRSMTAAQIWMTCLASVTMAAGPSTDPVPARSTRKPDPAAVYVSKLESAVIPPSRRPIPAPNTTAVDSPDRAARTDPPRYDTGSVIYRTIRPYVPAACAPVGYGGTYDGDLVHSWGWRFGVRYGDYGHHRRHDGYYGHHDYHSGYRRHHGYFHDGYGHHYGSHWGVSIHLRF